MLHSHPLHKMCNISANTSMHASHPCMQKSYTHFFCCRVVHKLLLAFNMSLWHRDDTESNIGYVHNILTMLLILHLSVILTNSFILHKQRELLEICLLLQVKEKGEKIRWERDHREAFDGASSAIVFSWSTS